MITNKNHDIPEQHLASRFPGGELTELERARQVLQDEIDAYKQQIIQRMRRLNDLVNINRLPVEILAEILLHWVSATRTSGIATYSESKRWIQIAHVCHLWREIALSTPRLWSEFSADNLGWTLEMLSRSKRAPLRITAPSQHHAPHDRSAIMKLLSQELPRVEHFAFRNSPSFANYLTPGLSAPLLRSLSIVSDSSYYNMPSNDPLPAAFEKIEMARLMHLDLAGAQLPWSTTLFKPSLTRLIFHSRSSPSHTGQYQVNDFAEVLRVLENMPLLEHLDLANVLPTFPGDQSTLPELDHYVLLPHIQTLILTASPMSCAFLLQHLNFPTATSMQIECRTIATDNLLDLTSVIASKLRDSSSTESARPLQSISCSGDSFVGWSDVLPLEKLTRGTIHQAGPRPRLQCVVLGDPRPRILTTVLPSLPLDRVQNVAVIPGTATASATPAQWLKVFSSMPSVRELAVSRWLDSISDALGQHLPLPDNQPKSGKGRKKKGDIPLPNLKALSLFSIRFRDFEDDESDEDSILKSCEKMLRERKAARRRIEHLTIKHAMNFDNDDCGRLKGLAKKVDWDGIVDWIEYEDDDEGDSWSDEDMYYPPFEYDDFYPW